MDKINYGKLQRFHSLMMSFDLGLFITVLLPFVLFIEQFVQPKKRGVLWRRVAVWVVEAVLSLNNIKIIVKKQHNIFSPAIYASNHPSHMDGFLVLTTLGSDSILFTAPLQQFNWLLAIWMKKMETVDVRRDPVDDERYPKGHSKQQAIELAIKFLREGKNLIIFPEGHIEILHVLHYFHTGAARIALSSHIDIVPVSIVNAERVFPDQHHLAPGSIILSFGERLSLPKNLSQEFPPNKTTVHQWQNNIESAIVEHLPVRYLPNYYQEKNKRVGVFVDIDRTMYEGLSQKDLISYLFWLHQIPAKSAFKVAYWLFLEKLHKIQHADLMRKALLVLKGWDVAELNKAVHETFEHKLLKNIQYGFFPLLKDHSELNHTIVLVSEVIHPLAREFKNLVHAKSSLDTRLQTVHHCYTGETTCLCYKEQKARLVHDFAKRANIDLNKSYAFADSSSDVPFLQLVKYPTAVNPDEKLLDYAVDHDWQVILNPN
ncbi:MAG: haloacid dehalogenase-like hydrolase [Patescibacteria group bacterium]